MASEAMIVGRDGEFFAENLARHLPALTFHAATDAASALGTCRGSDILIVRNDQITADLVGAMPRLRLIQALTTGTEMIEALPILPKGILLTAARGFHGPQMSELVFIYFLHFVRDLRGLIATQ